MFIVLEGIDGAGGETQTRLLVEFLEKMGIQTKVLSYPNPESPIGKIIYDYLNKRFELSPDVQMSLYATDMLLDRESINAALKDDVVVIANRYFLSTLAYQCGVKGVPEKDGLDFASLMRLPVPDLVIFIDISHETSVRRKYHEKGNLDRHEEDKDFLKRVRESYLNLVDKKIFTNEWIVVDGEKSIEDVAAEIREIVAGKLEIDS